MAVDTGAVDAAVIAVLAEDAALVALCPDGVWYAVAGQGAQAFVLVDRANHEIDANVFDSDDRMEVLGETFTYEVTAVIPETAPVKARQAGARIRALLDGNSLLAPAGFQLQKPIIERSGIRFPEPDPNNPDRVIQHWGARYDVQLMRR
jgi:hypothetical protein